MDFISFDWVEYINWVGINYLNEFLDEQEIKNRIIENFKNNIENEQSLINQINYLQEIDDKELLNYLPIFISNENLCMHTRITALEAYLSISDSYEELVNYVTDSKEFKWILIDKLISKDVNIEKELIILLIKSSEEDKLKISYYLLKFQNIDALKIIIEEFRNQKSFPSLLTNLNINPFPNLESTDLIPYITDLLNIVYENDFKDDEYDNMRRTVLSIFIKIALSNDEKTFEKIIVILKEFIQNNNTKNKKINFINVTIDDIERQYYMSETKTFILRDAIRIARDIIEE
ncbi:MAG: hypothetical protein IAE65_09515 [Ignavibacteria bacterium]|nr:hypothetical protein [Ignavibacteria bacterium]